MKKEIKGFICGVILTALLGCGVSAVGIWDNISVLRNDIKVVVNGSEVTADNFLYEDTTYLPLRAVSEALNQTVAYDESTNTAYIGERKDNDIMKSKYTPPQELQDGLLTRYEDGTYYIFFEYLIDVAKEKGIEIDATEIIANDFKTMTINGQSWDMVLLADRSYVPYDTYVDEIEPLLQ